VQEVKIEVQSSLIRLIQFFVRNILLISIKVMECAWLICLNMIAVPLQWNLRILQFILKKLLEGLCCFSFIRLFGVFGIIMNFFKYCLNLLFNDDDYDCRS